MSGIDRLTLVVAKRIAEADDILSVELISANGQDLPRFEAGAHIDVHVSDGLVRQYSLCNSPAERHRYRLGILRAPASRGGSAELHETLAEGSRLQVGLPRNAFRLREDTGDALLIAGGIGITPILSMGYRLHELGIPFELHYCVRSRGKAAFLDELASCSFHDRVIVHCDDEGPEQRLQPALFVGRTASDVYLCGPGGFMDWVTETAIAAGLAPTRIHSERFSGHDRQADNDAPSFIVTAARSGVTVRVGGATTIVEALRNHGVHVPVSCEQGVCGTCVIRVIDGIPEHLDLYLTDEEKADNTLMTPCCSRAKSSFLILDL